MKSKISIEDFEYLSKEEMKKDLKSYFPVVRLILGIMASFFIISFVDNSITPILRLLIYILIFVVVIKLFTIRPRIYREKKEIYKDTYGRKSSNL